MSYNFVHSGEQLLHFEATPWPLAPKPLIAAHAAVDKADDLLVDAIDAVDDSAVALPAAEAQYDLEAKAAVRAGKPLPSKEKLELATYKARLAKEDEATARQAINTTAGNVASLIEGGPEGDPELRKAWLTTIDARTDTLRAEIRDAADAIAPAVTELNALLGVGRFLAEWKELPYVPAPIEGNPVGALHAAANTRGHADNQGNIT